MNWGKGLFWVMTVFILFIVGMCYCMFIAPDDEYDHQYYEKGIAFDHDYNRQVQVFKDKAVPVIAADDETLSLTFSQPVTSGSLTLARPNNSNLDKTFVLNGSNISFSIPLKNIAKGRWQLVFDWRAGKKDYLYQKEVYLK